MKEGKLSPLSYQINNLIMWKSYLKTKTRFIHLVSSSFIIMVVLVTFSSCVDNEECSQDYLNADTWLAQENKLAGNNSDSIDAIYEEYLKRYKEIDSRCK
jgi:hypothetical protein